MSIQISQSVETSVFSAIPIIEETMNSLADSDMARLFIAAYTKRLEFNLVNPPIERVLQPGHKYVGEANAIRTGSRVIHLVRSTIAETKNDLLAAGQDQVEVQAIVDILIVNIDKILLIIARSMGADSEERSDVLSLALGLNREELMKTVIWEGVPKET